MSYTLKIDETSIEKIDNTEFPGVLRAAIEDDKNSDLLVPKNPVIQKDTKPSLKLPKIALMSAVTKESDIREHGGMDLQIGPTVQPMGTYGRLVKMPAITLKTKAKETDIVPMGTYGRLVKMPSLTLKKEADAGSSFPALSRANEGGAGSGSKGVAKVAKPKAPKLPKIHPPKVKKAAPKNPNELSSIHIKPTTPAKESGFRSKLMTRFMESVSGQSQSSRYLVTLISEGLGNLKDGFYYTAQALMSGAPLFEGQKCYANHPSAVEEQVLPERSVRDIIGHFENVQSVQVGDHQEIQGELVVMDGPDYNWVQSQLDHALDFSQKYTDKDFVGLSINAGGTANPVEIQQFMATYAIPPSCRPKVELAQAEGLMQVKIVDQITEAISCDLVTQAGAGGRIIKAL